SAQTQPNAATSVTSTKLVIRDNEKAYRENIGVNIGSTLKTCYIVFTPESTTNQNVTLATSNPEIAIVTARKADTTTYADITGITEGVTTLTATAADGGSTYSCLVTVRTPIEEAEGELTESMNLKQSALDTATSFETTCKAGQRGRIKGSVGNYYYFDCPAGVLEKNYHVAYVPKNKVTIYANRITLNKESITLNKGKKERLTATIHPGVTTNQTVTYQSSDTSIATVTARGVVKAKGKGQATITASVNSRYMGQDITRTATCQVTVTQPVKKLLLKPARLTLEKGRSRQLKAQIRPTNANDKTIEWSTSNTDVAEVDSNGKITAKEEGKATITALNPASGKKKSCNVTVLDKDLYELTGEMEMEVGKTYTFQVVKKGTIAKQAKKATASSNGIFTSSNPKIARVDQKTGKVTPLKPGTVTITCRHKKTHIVLSQKTVSILLTKAEKERLNKIKRFIIIKAGQERYLVGSSEGDKKDLTFTSSNTNVATVSNVDGCIRAKSEGFCKISTRLKYKSVSTTIYVYKPMEKHAFLEQGNTLYYEHNYGVKSEFLNKDTKVTIRGTINKDFYYVDVLNSRNNVLKSGVISQKGVLYYNSSANRDYFMKMKKGNWKNLRYSNKVGRDKDNHSPIQMVLVEDTIHIYVNFEYKGKGKNYVFDTETKAQKENEITYRKAFEEGIKKYWGEEGRTIYQGGDKIYKGADSATRKGKRYREKDFEKDVTLRCSVHFIRKQEAGDRRIPVYFGAGKKFSEDDSYWFFVYGGEPGINDGKYSYSWYDIDSTERFVSIPTNEELVKNTVLGKSERRDLDSYERTCAHEFGHVMGLNDAYPQKMEVDGKMIYKRRVDGDMNVLYYRGALIMKEDDSDNFVGIRSNDLEMVLYAYNQSQEKKNKYAWQSYYKHELGNRKYLRSKMITWKQVE
ncbi:MAG: Ig-like domain-containing protein, partial [Lachnospira sp.]|nr:Ig-like domain-containing protein [Lachnospira sp.]